MRQSEILKARTQQGDLGRDERTMSEPILRLERMDWIYLSNYRLLINNRFVESISCMRSVVRWFVINEPKGKWKETVVKLASAIPHHTQSFLNSLSCLQ
jgi:hypothetical protein